MYTKSTTPLLYTYNQKQTVSYKRSNCYSHSVIKLCDAELTQDDSYDDDLLGNELFCRDYDTTAH